MNYKKLYPLLFLVITSINIINAKINSSSSLSKTEEKIQHVWRKVTKKITNDNSSLATLMAIRGKLENQTPFNRIESIEAAQFSIAILSAALLEAIDLDIKLTPLEQQLVQEGFSRQEAQEKSAEIFVRSLSTDSQEKIALNLLAESPPVTDLIKSKALAFNDWEKEVKNGSEIEKIAHRTVTRFACIMDQIRNS